LFVGISSAQFQTRRDRRVYQTTDWGGLVVLVVLAAVFMGTGLTIRSSLYNNGHPEAGDIAALIAGGIALVWGLLYLAFRVSVRAVVSPAGFALWHGWWRHTISWRDMARFSEWQAVQDSIRYRWLALWSVDGMRLQVREDLAGDFAGLRAEILRYLAEPARTPPDYDDLSKPLAMTERTAPLVAGWLVAAVIFISAGALTIAFLTTVQVVGIVFLAAGGLCTLIALLRGLLRQTVTVGPEGVSTRRGTLVSRMSWTATYGLHRDRRLARGGVLPLMARALVMVLYRLDSRSGVVLGRTRAQSVITVRGNSGERILIVERRYDHPEWLRGRLRAEVAALQARAEAPPISPLPPTGPLAPGVVLPPDPAENSETLWSREDINSPFS
jgi:hypothetical protein